MWNVDIKAIEAALDKRIKGAINEMMSLREAVIADVTRMRDVAPQLPGMLRDITSAAALWVRDVDLSTWVSPYGGDQNAVRAIGISLTSQGSTLWHDGQTPFELLPSVPAGKYRLVAFLVKVE